MIIIAKSNLTSKVLAGALVSTGALAFAGAAHADTQVTVKAGDTVSQLALDNDSSVDAVTQKNQLADPNFIVVGQKLDIPNDHNDNNSNPASNTQSKTNAVAPTSFAANSTAGTINPTSSVDNSTDNNATIPLKSSNMSVALPPQQTTNANVSANTNISGQNQAQPVAATTNTQAASAATPVASNNTPVNASHSPQQAVAIAQQQIGTPYVWGGNQPGGFDCSGLVQYAYGLDAAHRTTYTQQTMGTHRYDVENAQPGDIYFWGSDTAPYHEALATGNGNYIQAPRPGQNVQNGNINYYRPNYFVSMNH